MADAPPAGAPRAARGPRFRLAAAVAIGLAGLLAALTDIQISGHWHGLFLLRGRGDSPLQLKDDLFLGDGSRLVAGVSLSRLRRVLGAPSAAGGPRLELEWSDGRGNGLVRNHLGDGTELVTVFSRFTDDDGLEPRGLFVGGAVPDVAASAQADESGMTFRDARGWHHVWCNVNELLLDVEAGKRWFPGAWRFLGARVLIRDPDRVVIETSHAIPLESGTLRVDRYAYFRAGKSWFKLGLRFTNAGERPLRFAYAYGDEPWVGHFGSSANNLGFLPDRIVSVEGPVDASVARHAGIVDVQSGLAAFLAWSEESRPYRVFFANEPGSRFRRLGQPLDSNGVAVGLEWVEGLRPGETRSLLLAIGMTRAAAPGEVPALPDGAAP